MELSQNSNPLFDSIPEDTLEPATDVPTADTLLNTFTPSTEVQPKMDWLNRNFVIVGAFLQQPRQYFQEIKHAVRISEKIGSLLVSSIIFLASYGAVLGSGDPRLSLNSAIGLPLLFLGSLATCIPVMYLLDVLTGSQRSLGQTIAVLFTSLNAAGTVCFSFAPIMLLFRLTGTLTQYFLLNVGILATATLVGLIYVVQGLIQTNTINEQHPLYPVNRRLHFVWIFLFLVVISQMAWAMLTFFQTAGGFSNLL